MPRSTHLALAILSAAALGIAAPAHADIITSLSAAPTAVQGGYAYTYNVQLSGGQLDPANGTDRDGNPVVAQFGTVYDFGPVVGAITTTGYLSQFSWTLMNVTAPAQLTSPADDPNVLNIRFTYTGTNPIGVQGQPTTYSNAILIPAGSANLGTFTVTSVYGPDLNNRIQYDGQTYKGTNNTEQANVGFTSGPALPSAVPEPMSLALLGSGLAAVGLLRRRT